MGKTKKIKTNKDFIVSLMDDPNSMMQIFIIEAITRWAELTVAQKAELIKQGNPMINMEAWVQCAEKFLDERRKFYNEK